MIKVGPTCSSFLTREVADAYEMIYWLLKVFFGSSGIWLGCRRTQYLVCQADFPVDLHQLEWLHEEGSLFHASVIGRSLTLIYLMISTGGQLWKDPLVEGQDLLPAHHSLRKSIYLSLTRVQCSYGPNWLSLVYVSRHDGYNENPLKLQQLHSSRYEMCWLSHSKQ